MMELKVIVREKIVWDYFGRKWSGNVKKHEIVVIIDGKEYYDTYSIAQKLQIPHDEFMSECGRLLDKVAPLALFSGCTPEGGVWLEICYNNYEAANKFAKLLEEYILSLIAN